MRKITKLLNAQVIQNWLSWTDDRYYNEVLTRGVKFADDWLVLTKCSPAQQRLFWDVWEREWDRRNASFISAMLPRLAGLRATDLPIDAVTMHIATDLPIDAVTMHIAYNRVHSLYELCRSDSLSMALRRDAGINLRKQPKS